LRRISITTVIFEVKASFNLVHFQHHAIIMQKRLAILTSILVICTIMAFAGIVSAQDTTPVENVIHATGSGNVIGSPDRAQIAFSVETENPDVKTAQQANADQMTKVMDALHAAGIPKDALKTTGYNIYPVYDNTKTIFDQKIKTYHVTNTITVTLHDVSKVGEIIDVGVAAGVNQVSSIQFMLSDEQAQVLRTEALKEAVVRARSDAGTVAGALGVNITGSKNVEINQGYMPVVFSNYDMAASAKSAAPTPIQPGDITVTATVTITYTYN
jgi:uncharacterized protein